MRIVYGKKFFGIIYVTNGVEVFPASDWDDFAKHIIDDWYSELEKVINCDAEFDLWFMDGPYRLKCTKTVDSLHINAVDDHDGSIVFKETMPFIEFYNEVKKAADALISVKDEREIR